MKRCFFVFLSVINYSLFAGEFFLSKFLDQESPYSLETLEKHIENTQNQGDRCAIAIIRSHQEKSQPYWCEAQELATDVLRLKHTIIKHAYTQDDVLVITPYTISLQGGDQGFFMVDKHDDINAINILPYAIKHARQKVFEDYFVNFAGIVPTPEKYFFITFYLDRLAAHEDVDIARRALLLNALIKAQAESVNKKLSIFTEHFQEAIRNEAHNHCNSLLGKGKAELDEDKMHEVFYFLTTVTHLCSSNQISSEIFKVELSQLQSKFGHLVSQAVNDDIDKLLGK